MLKKLFSRPQLVEQTALAHFVRDASSSEKRKVYNRVIQQAADEQRLMISRAPRQRPKADRAAV